MPDDENGTKDDRRQEERRYDDRRLKDTARSDHDLLVEVCSDVRHIEETVDQLVTKLEFAPVKLIAYALVGMLLSGIVAAILALVVHVKAG